MPWCLPNTADRHNGWRGLFGRLDAHGHFPTSTTDPQPMGKVGQVFHPTQVSGRGAAQGACVRRVRGGGGICMQAEGVSAACVQDEGGPFSAR